MNPFGLTSGQWIDLGISALIVLATAVVGRWLVHLLLGRAVHRLTRSTSTGLDDALLSAIRPPLYWLALTAALQIALDRLEFVEEAWGPALDDLYFVLYLLIGFAAAWRLVSRLASWYGAEVIPRTEDNLGQQLMPFLRRVAHILLVVVVAIILLGHFEVEVSGLVATLGIGSLAFALAAQAALSDTISGFVIMVDRPYRIGDRIEIQDLDTWGDVVDIGLRSTRIRTRDNRMVIVPNSVIGKSLIVNHSYPDTQYRLQIEVGVAYGTDLEQARRTLIESVRGVKGVLPERPVEALFLEFGDSALIFRVRWWLESYVDTRVMFDRVNTAMYNALEKAGIEIPFPQLDLHHKVDAGDAPRISRALRGAG